MIRFADRSDVEYDRSDVEYEKSEGLNMTVL